MSNEEKVPQKSILRFLIPLGYENITSVAGNTLKKLVVMNNESQYFLNCAPIFYINFNALQKELVLTRLRRYILQCNLLFCGEQVSDWRSAPGIPIYYGVL